MSCKSNHWCVGFAAFLLVCLSTPIARAQAIEPAVAEDAAAQESAEASEINQEEGSKETDSEESSLVGDDLTADELQSLREVFDQLGSPDFQVRESANNRLSKFGARAIKPLKKWQSEAKSAEVIARSQLVIDHIERTGFNARIEQFMRAPGNIEQHKFYGWNAFSQVLGKSRMARQLFVSLLERYSRLCTEDISGDKLVAYQEEYVKLLKGDIEEFNETSLADAIVAQYLMVQLQDKSSAELESISGRLTSTAPYSSELNTSATKTLKRLTGLWINSIQREPYRALIVGLDYSLPEGAVLARKTLSSGDTGDQNFGLCMETIMVQGTPDDLPLIESFFGDTRTSMKESMLNAGGQIDMIVQEYRDLALAVAVRIRGFTMTDYFPTALNHHLRVFNPESIIFVGPNPQAARQAAFERYAAAVAAEKSKAN